MPSVTYRGPAPAVDVPWDGDVITATAGQPTDVPEALAASLAEQDTWDTGERTRTTKSATRKKDND